MQLGFVCYRRNRYLEATTLLVGYTKREGSKVSIWFLLGKTMRLRPFAVVSLVLILFLGIGRQTVSGQVESAPLEIFGYFQNEFEHQHSTLDGSYNTFALQQLNLFFQKDLGKGLTSFVNFETVNNFSTSRRWGSIDLREAWVRYKVGRRLNLKFGLQIPIFNNLNEIKNRTPLLPYVIRPIVYETSFSEFIPIEFYVPQRAFVQAYGFLQAGDIGKIDFAAYVGNSPNINSLVDNEVGGDNRTGTDTTNTFLVGGRVGFRAGELKVGASGTVDRSNQFQGLEVRLGGAPDDFRDVRRRRAGADVSFRYKNILAEGEYIRAGPHEDIESFDLDLTFAYGTLGYRLNDKWFVYGSYWHTYERAQVGVNRERAVLYVPNFGASMNLRDNVTLKAQYAYVIGRAINGDVRIRETINFYSVAMSVIL